MKKVIKVLLLIEALLVVATIFILLVTSGRDDFSFLLAAIPGTAAVVLGVVIMSLFFIHSVKASAKASPIKSVVSLAGIIIPLIALPYFGIYYSTLGDNREGLATVSNVALWLGVILSIVAIIRFFKLRK